MNESYNSEAMKTLRLIANTLWRRGRRFSVSFTSFPSLTSLASFHHRVRLNLHQHFRRNQLAHFHHARRRPDLSEKFSMRPPNLFPFLDVCHINSRPHNVFEAGASLDERRLDVLDRLHRLRAQIAHAHDLSIRPRRRCSRYRNDVADSYGPRVPHNRFPRRPARNVLTRHPGLPFVEIIERIIYSLLVRVVRKWLAPRSRGTPWEDAKLIAIRRRNRDD